MFFDILRESLDDFTFETIRRVCHQKQTVVRGRIVIVEGTSGGCIPSYWRPGGFTETARNSFGGVVAT